MRRPGSVRRLEDFGRVRRPSSTMRILSSAENCLAISLLRDVGETTFADRRYDVERYREPGNSGKH